MCKHSVFYRLSLLTTSSKSMVYFEWEAMFNTCLVYFFFQKIYNVIPWRWWFNVCFVMASECVWIWSGCRSEGQSS